MATAIELLDVNMIANADLSTKQFFIVKQTGTVDKATAFKRSMAALPCCGGSTRRPTPLSLL